MRPGMTGRNPTQPSSKTRRQLLSGAVALAVVSHVTFLTGNIYPVREVAGLARERGARLLVDGADSFGLLPFSCDDIQCDMYNHLPPQVGEQTAWHGVLLRAPQPDPRDLASPPG
jgi:hypothetical protein